MCEHISPMSYDWFQQHKSNWVVSHSTKATLEKSCMKLDIQANYRHLDYPCHLQGVSFMSKMYDHVFQSPILNQNQILERLNLDSAVGEIENARGFRFKRECVEFGLDTTEYENDDFPEEIPIWKVSGKVELKREDEYINDLKQRTFIIQPFKSLWHHMKLYSAQSDALKMTGWSAYGLNPYEGGVDNLARSLLRGRRFWVLDGKGWDRVISILKVVYEEKSKYIPQRYREMAERVARHATESILKFPNGDYVLKSWGNNSGSGSTTADNIFMMTIVLSAVFFHLGCSERQILELVIAFVFGDDVIGSDNLDCSDEELEAAFRFVFTDLYGVVLDPFYITRDLCDPKITFLGFAFTKVREDRYVPLYDLGRLCSSFIFDDTKEYNPDKELNKMISLMLMSAGHGKEVYNFFRLAIVDCIMKSDCETAVRIRKISDDRVAVPTFKETINWYLGTESKSRVNHSAKLCWGDSRIFHQSAVIPEAPETFGLLEPIASFTDGIGWNKELFMMATNKHKQNNTNAPLPILRKNAEKEKKYKEMGDVALLRQVEELRSRLAKMRPAPQRVQLQKGKPFQQVGNKIKPGKGLLIPKKPSPKLAPKQSNLIGKKRNQGKRHKGGGRNRNAPSWDAWKKAGSRKGKKKRVHTKKSSPSRAHDVEGQYGNSSSTWWDTATSFADKFIKGKGGEMAGLADMAITGLGDYDIDTNSVEAAATGGHLGNNVPMMVNSKCSNTLRHREYLGDIFSSNSNFSAVQFSINPGLFSTFPWLAPIANCFTSYRMRGLIYEFNSLATEYSAQTSLGFVALGTQYNTIDPPFTDKITMLNSEYANSRKPSETFMHAVECAGNQLVLEQLYVRDQSPPNDTDIRFYDLGTLTLAVGGQVANDEIIGELWASYECEFYQPKNDFQFITLFDVYETDLNEQPKGYDNNYVLTGASSDTCKYSGPNMVPSIIKLVQEGGSNISQILFFGNNYGRYRLDFTWTGDAAASFAFALPAPAFTSGFGCTIVSVAATGLYPFLWAPSAGSSTLIVMISLFVDLHEDLDPNQLPFLNLTGGGSTALPGSTTTNNVRIVCSQVPSPNGPASSMRELTRKAGKIWMGQRDKFQTMRFEEDYDTSSDTDSSEEEQSPLDLIVKATDGSITMEQQAMLLKLYTEMLKNQPQQTKELKEPKIDLVKDTSHVSRRIDSQKNPMAQVRVTSSLVPPKPEEYDREIEREIAEEKRLKELEKLMLRMQIEKDVRREIKEQQAQQVEEYQARFVKPQAHFPGFYDVVVKQKPQISEEENPEKPTCQVTTTCPF